jgi:thermopsin
LCAENRVAAAALIILLVLMSSGPLVAGHHPADFSRAQQTFTGYSIVLQPDYNLPIPINISAYGFQLSFSVQSSVPLDIYVMNQGQYNTFERYGSVAYLYGFQTENISRTLGIGAPGNYYLVINNDISRSAADVNYSYGTIPVGIYTKYSGAPAPTGLADYGEEINSAGYVVPYEVVTSGVLGQATINAIGAYNGSSADPYGASLQLNVMLQVNTTSGQYSYWLQDIADFTTNKNEMMINDNVWNASAQASSMISSITAGRGEVTLWQQGDQYYYGYSTATTSYSLPLQLLLPISVSSSHNSITLTFGYQVNGGPRVTYDTVTITEPSSVINASILVSGYRMTPSGNYYDAELVFGGEENGEATTFTSMNSELMLFYRMPNGTFVSPYAAYEFGSDTAESAYNLQTVLQNGNAFVTIGSPDFSSYIYWGAELNYTPPPQPPGYSFTWNEIGLPEGAGWEVTVNGDLYYTTNSSLTISGLNGLLYWSAKNVSISGYTYYPTNPGGTIEGAGNASIVYELSQGGAPAPALPFGFSMDQLVGALLFIIAIVAIVAALSSRRRRKGAAAQNPSEGLNPVAPEGGGPAAQWCTA